MQKEAIIAILSGLILGLATTAGVYYFKVRNQEKQVVKTEETLESQLSPTPTPEVKNQLVLSSPLDGLVTLDTQATVKGQFIPNNYLVITTNKKTEVLSLAENNQFEELVNLEIGPNMIYVTGVQTDGNTHPASRFVFRDTPLEEASASATASKSANLTASGSAENISTTAAILARINKKVKKVKAQSKRAVFGKITEITAESITLSNPNGDFTFALKDIGIEKKGKGISIKEVEVGKWATMLTEVTDQEAKQKELTPTLKLKPIKLEVYDTSPVTKMPEVIIGDIKTVKSNQLVIASRLDSQEVKVKLTNSTKIYDLNYQDLKTNELETDLAVIVVAEKDAKDKLVANQVKVLVNLDETKDEK